MLGGIQARLELGPYNPDTHTLSFIKNEMYRFLPEHASWSSTWSGTEWFKKSVKQFTLNSYRAHFFDKVFFTAFSRLALGTNGQAIVNRLFLLGYTRNQLNNTKLTMEGVV